MNGLADLTKAVVLAVEAGIFTADEARSILACYMPGLRPAAKAA
jgi:hypothetical protein